MAKRVFIAFCMLIGLTIGAFAQQSYSQNPFSKVRYLNDPTDTITLIASYSQINYDVNIINKAILETIKRNTGKQVKGLNYSIDLKLENYPIILSVPCKDYDMINVLAANVSKNNKVIIKCVVYRFYYYDGICSFFYIDKIKLLNKPNLVTRVM
jgi:hypothetical protein